MGKRTTKKETALMNDAFELYYAMGKGRSCEKIARAIGMAHETVLMWNRSFKWQQRVIDRDERLNSQFSMANEQRISAIKQRTLNMIEKIIDNANKYYEDGITVKSTKIKALTPNDIEKLVKAHALLSGEATERVGVPKDTKFQVEFV